MNSRLLIPIFALGAATSACYSTALDSSLDEVFACRDDVDCALGAVCIGQVCRDEAALEGPILTVLDPPELAIFPIGETATVPLVIQGENLVLSSGNSDDAAAGYIEVLLDGAVVDTVTEGDLELGITVDSLIAPAAGGLHHIGLVARRLDGELFRGDSGNAATAFWIDDGREHVGILSPAPGFKIPVELEEIALEVASLNFTFVNPGFIGPDEVTMERAGYVHLYVDADVPSCIPSCNFEHQSVVTPAGLSRVNRIQVARGVTLPGELGTARLQIVAQDLLQQPYYRADDPEDLVFHQVPVQSIVEVAP